MSYKTVVLPSGTFYYYDIPNSFYTEGNAKRMRLCAMTEDKLKEKILAFNSAQDAMRIEAFGYAKDFADMYTLYLREYISESRRYLICVYQNLLSNALPSGRRPEREDFIEFFNNYSQGRTKEQLKLISGIFDEICSFSAKYGILYTYPVEYINTSILTYKNTHMPYYTEEEYQIIKKEILRKDKKGRYKYESSAFIILFQCDVCNGYYEVLNSHIKDIKGKTIIFNSAKKRSDIRLGINEVVLTDELYNILCELNNVKDLSELSPDAPILPSIPELSKHAKHLRKILLRTAMPDDITPVNFAKQIRKMRSDSNQTS